MTYMQAHRYLMQFAIRPSVQRTAVMEYLMNHKTHPTVDEIYMALSPGIPTLSKTTVYNTLNLFIDKGAVQMLTIDEKNARYDADTSRHAHFYCNSCGKVTDLMELKPTVYELPEMKDYTVTSVQLSFYGTCKHCRKN